MGMGSDKGTDSSIRLDRQCSSLELSHKVSWMKVYTFNPSSPSSCGRTTLMGDKVNW